MFSQSNVVRLPYKCCSLVYPQLTTWEGLFKLGNFFWFQTEKQYIKQSSEVKIAYASFQKKKHKSPPERPTPPTPIGCGGGGGGEDGRVFIAPKILTVRLIFSLSPFPPHPSHHIPPKACRYERRQRTMPQLQVVEGV